MAAAGPRPSRRRTERRRSTRGLSSSRRAGVDRAAADAPAVPRAHGIDDAPGKTGAYVDRTVALDSSGRVPRADLHHLPRLLPRLVLPVAPREPHRGLPHGPPDTDAFRQVAAVARRTPCHRRRPRPARRRRRLYHDSAGVPVRTVVEENRLPADAQPVQHVRDRVADRVRHHPAVLRARHPGHQRRRRTTGFQFHPSKAGRLPPRARSDRRRGKRGGPESWRRGTKRSRTPFGLHFI